MVTGHFNYSNIKTGLMVFIENLMNLIQNSHINELFAALGSILLIFFCVLFNLIFFIFFKAFSILFKISL